MLVEELEEADAGFEPGLPECEEGEGRAAFLALRVRDERARVDVGVELKVRADGDAGVGEAFPRPHRVAGHERRERAHPDEEVAPLHVDERPDGVGQRSGEGVALRRVGCPEPGSHDLQPLRERDRPIHHERAPLAEIPARLGDRSPAHGLDRDRAAPDLVAEAVHEDGEARDRRRGLGLRGARTQQGDGEECEDTGERDAHGPPLVGNSSLGR
jgi:hypothetical protein